MCKREEDTKWLCNAGAEGVSPPSQQGFSWGSQGRSRIGELSVGDGIRTLPSGETAKVTQIFNTEQDPWNMR